MQNFARSLAIHGTIVALILIFGASVHQVAKQTHVEHLVFTMPADLPVPLVRPDTQGKQAQSAPGSPSLLQVGSSARLDEIAEKPEVAPSFLKLDTSSSLALPQGTQSTQVGLAPQAKQTGFGTGTPSGNGTTRGLAQTGGFGSAYGSGSTGNGHVVKAGFEQQPAALPVLHSAPVTIPVLVYSIPKARYSDEAREAHVVGDVLLQVRFTAAGSVEVLQVIQSPGYGLDSIARSVAAGIQFRPAYQDGKPVDSIHVVTVSFDIS